MAERVWLPNSVVQLAAVSPELENVEGTWWVRQDIADERVREARREVWQKAMRAVNGAEEYTIRGVIRALEAARTAAEAKGE